MRIIVNALSGNGDALMFSPALRLLKEKLPSSKIDMLVMFKSVKEMYEHSPFLNNIYFVDFLRQSKGKSFKEMSGIGKNDYDVSINVYPANRIEYNVVSRFTGAGQRISHHYNHTNIARGEFLNTDLVQEVQDRHNVLQNIDLLKKIPGLEYIKDEDAGGLEIYTGSEDKRKADEWIKSVNPEGKLAVGFHSGSALLKNHIHKRWDAEKYAELGRKLMEKHNAVILLFGIEYELNDSVNGMLGGKGVIASTSNYMDSMARMAHCGLFVSNDTAFLHSAAAFKLSTVGIFGYTNAKELYPWQTEHIIIRKELECSPCFYNSPKPAECRWKGVDEFKCMKLIDINEVYEACRKLIEKVPHDSKP